jgi:hypothetical protein
MVRSIAPLVHVQDFVSLRPRGGQPLASESLLGWSDAGPEGAAGAEALIGLGLLRLARLFPQANALKETLRPRLGAEWRAVFENEEAALAWHQGDWAEAMALWNDQEQRTPVLFNLGMAALFAGRASEARSLLGRAIAQWPEDGSWHHLGRLYLAVAEAAA